MPSDEPVMVGASPAADGGLFDVELAVTAETDYATRRIRTAFTLTGDVRDLKVPLPLETA
jgi:hypothetical protein